MELASTHVHTDWMAQTVEDRITQLLHLAESFDVTAIERISADCHDALTSGWSSLDAKIQLAALERARRLDEAATHSHEAMDMLHDGHANAVGERMGITDQEFV